MAAMTKTRPKDLSKREHPSSAPGFPRPSKSGLLEVLCYFVVFILVVCYVPKMAEFEIDLTDFQGTRINFSDGARLIERGGEGVAVADGDNVVKIFFNHGHSDDLTTPNPAVQQKARREYDTLHLLHAYNNTGINIPFPFEVIEFNRTLRSGPIHYYIAALRMSRLDGRSPDIKALSAQPSALNQILFDAGHAIGLLHSMMANIPRAAMGLRMTRADQFFQYIEQLGRPSKFISQHEIETLRRLHKEHDLKNPERILIHGDPGLHNVLINDSNHITGIVDWSSTRFGCREEDFFHYVTPYTAHLKQLGERVMAHAMIGYHAATSIRLDPESARLFAATTLGWQIIDRERADQTGGIFEQYPLSRFKELMMLIMNNRNTPSLERIRRNNAQD